MTGKLCILFLKMNFIFYFILEKYYDNAGYNLGAEHDEISIYATDLPVSAEDIKTLLALGAFGF